MRFLNRALSWLDGVYDFRGSRVRTDDVDLSTVQLVHDVGPSAIGESARMVWATLQIDSTTTPPVAVGDNYLQLPLRTYLEAEGVNVFAEDAYLCNAWIAGEAISFGGVGLLRQEPTGKNPVTGVGIQQTLGWWEDVRNLGVGLQDFFHNRDGGMGSNIHLPYRVIIDRAILGSLNNDTLVGYFQATSASASICIVVGEFMIVPKGAVPPPNIYGI